MIIAVPQNICHVYTYYLIQNKYFLYLFKYCQIYLPSLLLSNQN